MPAEAAVRPRMVTPRAVPRGEAPGGEFVGGVEGGADGGGFEDVAGPVFEDVPAGLVGGVFGEGVADDVFEVLDLGHVVELVGVVVGFAEDGAELVVGVVEGFAVGGWWGTVAGGGDDRGVEGEFAGLSGVAGLDGAAFEVGDGGSFGDVEDSGVVDEGVGQAGEGFAAAFEVAGQGLEVLREHLGCFTLPVPAAGQPVQFRRLIRHPQPEHPGVVLQVLHHLRVARQRIEPQTGILPI